MDNITSEGELTLSNIVGIEATASELKNYTLRDGDFIYNTRNAPNLVGKSSVYHGVNDKYIFNNNILRIRFNKNVNQDYVNFYLNTPTGKNKIRKLVHGTTSVAALYQKNFATIFSLSICGYKVWKSSITPSLSDVLFEIPRNLISVAITALLLPKKF